MNLLKAMQTLSLQQSFKMKSQGKLHPAARKALKQSQKKAIKSQPKITLEM